MPQIPRSLINFLVICQHLALRFIRPMTLGVRAAVFDDQNRVLLVRHSYLPGWHLPGGGVDPGETLQQAVARELREETAIELNAPAMLHGVFFNNRYSKRDHVAVFVSRDFRSVGERKPDWEIREVRFFALDGLPPDTARATRDRIREITEEAPPPAIW
ncbi:MAG: NUDIX domain-containing protein [Hyphomicrobiales bacterium]|nr:NUDIX domain-containing protein [Hyphomicrobiales bacterium]